MRDRRLEGRQRGLEFALLVRPHVRPVLERQGLAVGGVPEHLLEQGRVDVDGCQGGAFGSVGVHERGVVLEDVVRCEPLEVEAEPSAASDHARHGEGEGHGQRDVVGFLEGF